jgi:hypothetical protein
MKHLLLLLFSTVCLAQNSANAQDFRLDSVNIEKVIYNNKIISSKIATLEGDNIKISSDKTIILNCTNPDGLSVDGIKAGDTEEKLKSKFPKSSLHKSLWSSQYSDLTSQYRYYYIVEILDDGYIQFNVEDKIIKKIEVKFRE